MSVLNVVEGAAASLGYVVVASRKADTAPRTIEVADATEAHDRAQSAVRAGGRAEVYSVTAGGIRHLLIRYP